MKINKELKNEFVNPFISTLSKKMHNNLIDILHLKDEQKKYNGT